MDLLSSGKTLNNALMKKSLRIIKKVTYINIDNIRKKTFFLLDKISFIWRNGIHWFLCKL